MKGIREFAKVLFVQMLPQLGTLGNTEFRRAVMDELRHKHGVSIASAATHYNEALKAARITHPNEVADLGRPDDKKGGRPVVHPMDVISIGDGKVVASGISSIAANDMVVAQIRSGRGAALATRPHVPTEAMAA